MAISDISKFVRKLFSTKKIKMGDRYEVRRIHCETHGDSLETFVCQHIIVGMIEKKRVGFFWTAQDPENPHPDAWCAKCEDRVKMTDGEWEGEALELLSPKTLCGECYEVAKKFHMGGNPWS